MANVLYNSFKKDILSGAIDLTSDTIKVALVTSSYTPDQDGDADFSDVSDEITGTGYTAGGATLTSLSVTQDNTNDRGVFDADDVTWSTSTITARGAVVYKSTGTSATSNLICYIDFSTDQVSSAGDFKITWSADGIVYLS